MSDRDVLLGMGFDPQRVAWALKATNNRGLQPAMDHILEHEGDPVPDESAQSSAPPSKASGLVDEDDEDLLRAQIAPVAGGSSAGGEEARSIKCSECGKVFKNTALANFHAEKSGHDQFEESTEEIKSLTEEEKKEKLSELREKMAAKRAVKATEEAKEAKANELIRRKAGQDMGQMRDDLKVKEAAKDAERKRQEKIDEARARAAVKAQIEADKKARAEKAAREKALREGAPPPESAAPAAATPAAPAKSGKDYAETRLQIRLAAGGAPVTTSLPSDSTLRDVATFLSQQSGVDASSVSFAMHFPRRQFSATDIDKTLRDLGLTPSAVLIAS